MFNDNLTIPLVGDEYKQLDLTADDNFKKEFAPDDVTAGHINNTGMFIRNTGTPTSPTYSLRSYYEPTKSNRLDLKKYLTDNLPAHYQSTAYNNYLIVFFINIIGFSMKNDTTRKDQLGGYSNGKGTNLLVFKLSSIISKAVSHEVYHSLNLPHTFDKLEPSSLFAYRAEKTDNLMDYSHLAGKTIRSLYHWQWLVARKNVKK